jgi:hypothetical protein
VGARIMLLDLNKQYSLNRATNDSAKRTTADIPGKYVFKNVPAARYLLYTSSKCSIVIPYYLYSDLTGSQSENLQKMTGFDFRALRKDLQDQIKPTVDESLKLADEKKFKKYEKLDKEIHKKIE